MLRLRNLKQHKWLGGLAALVLIILIVGLFLLIHRPAKVATIPSTNPATAVSKKTTSAQQAQPSTSPTGKTATATATPTTGNNSPPITPTGNFVSNHRPGQNGSSTTESSTCNTTPGATCYIEFTNGDLARTLASKTVDSNGAVYWNWDVGSAGLTSGSWQIKAIATLNGHAESTTDSNKLEIQ